MRQYRELEDVVERQCEELRGWKEQYHKLEEKVSEPERQLGLKDIALDAQRKKIKELESELKKVSEQLEGEKKEKDEALRLLKAEGFNRGEADKQVNQFAGEVQKLKASLIGKDRQIVALRNRVDFYESRGLLDRIMNVRYEEA